MPRRGDSKSSSSLDVATLIADVDAKLVKARAELQEILKKAFHGLEMDVVADRIKALETIKKNLMELRSEQEKQRDENIFVNRFGESGLLIQVECPVIEPTIVIQCFDSRETIFELKERIFRQLMSHEDETLVFSKASLLIMMKGDVALGDDKLVVDSFNKNFEMVELVKKPVDDFTDIDKQLFQGAFLLAMNEADKIKDGMELNTKPKLCRGTLNIKCLLSRDKLTLKYHYGDESFASVYRALEKLTLFPCGDSGEFKLKWIGSPSILFEYEGIHATVQDMKECELVLSLKGGAKSMVRKTAFRKKRVTDDEVLTVQTDQSKFENAFRACVSVSSNTDYKFEKAIAEMPIAQQQELFNMLTDDSHATNASRVAKVCDFLPEYKAMIETEKRLTFAMHNFQEMVKEMIETTHGRTASKQVDGLKLLTSNALAVAKARASDVSMPDPSL